jgi:outer membrane protein
MSTSIWHHPGAWRQMGLTCALAFFIGGGAIASTTTPVDDKPAADLLSMLKWAENTDPGLASARLAVQADRDGIARARSGFLPQIVGSWVRERSNVIQQDLPSLNYTQRRWQVSLSQTLFNWETWTSYRQSELEQAKSAVRLSQAYQELFMKVATAYFGVLSAQEELMHIDGYRDRLKQQLQHTEVRFGRGDATLIDMRDIQSAIDRQTVQASLIAGELQARQLALEEYASGPLPRIAPLREDLEAPLMVPQDMASWVARAKRSNFDVQFQLLEKKRARMETSKAQGAYLPTIGVSATHTPVGSYAHLPRTTTNTIMIQLNIPIFSGLDTVHRVRQTLTLEEKAGSDLERTERNSAAAVRETFVQLQTNRERLRGLSDAVDSSRAALAANEVGYRIGGRSDSDILQARNSLFTVQRDLTRARYDIILQGLRLKLLTASLEFEDVAAINGLLDRSN